MSVVNLTSPLTPVFQKFSLITTHGFIKKTQKTPQKEIERAETIREEYYKSKQKKMSNMKFYTENEALDKVIGGKETSARQEYDAQMQEFLIGEAIRQARQSRNLTQEQLGELVGVKKAQISKIENGSNVTFSTIARLFNAMNIKAMLDLGSMGKVALF